jgi:putative transposase
MQADEDRARPTYYERLEKAADDTAAVEAMFAISDEFEFYGYRRIGARCVSKAWL